MIALAISLPAVAAAQDEPAAGSARAPDRESSLRITSPMGRTGVTTRVRIVAQATLPPGAVISAVSFYVDGALVGTVEPNDGPPYAVDWLDDNPMLPREIVVQAADSTGHLLSDTVRLPGFEIEDVTEVTSILLETGVYDRKSGRPVSTLDQSAFAVSENGVTQVVDLVTRETLPTTLVLLVDNSHSMHRRMDFVRGATARLAAVLGPRDQVIVAPFSAAIPTITGPTNDPGTISSAIEAMRAEGGTAILDSLVNGADLLDGLDGRRVIVLMTDGYDENSETTYDAAIDAVARSQTTVYVIGIGGVAGISIRGERLLRQIAERTGGRTFFPPREVDLGPVATDVIADAHSRYLVTYMPSNRRKDGSWREVVVEVPDGLRAVTRAGYFAPKPPPIRPTVEFTVTNAFRDFVNVTLDDVEVFEDDEPQVIDTFQEAVDPVSIVMAIDSSGSLRREAAQVQETAREFVLAVRPEDSLALITFADRPRFAHTLATNRSWTLEAIDKYVAVGGTALYDALYNSLLHLRDGKGRRAVVVLTDGRDEDNPGTGPGSRHVFDEVLALLGEVDAAIFAIGLGSNVDRDVLERLAHESGGAAYYAADTTELADRYRLVIESLRQRYVIGYTSTNSDHDGGWREVEIRHRSEGYTVWSSGGYYAPVDSN